MAFDSISGLHVPAGGSTRQITVGVIWQPLSQGVSAGTKLQVTYSMSVVQQSSVKWYVKEISASIERWEPNTRTPVADATMSAWVMPLTATPVRRAAAVPGGQPGLRRLTVSAGQPFPAGRPAPKAQSFPRASLRPRPSRFPRTSLRPGVAGRPAAASCRPGLARPSPPRPRAVLRQPPRPGIRCPYIRFTCT